MDIRKIYENYGSYLVEQEVISKDLNDRLVQYLEVDDIISAVVKATNDTPEGEKNTVKLDRNDYKFIQKGDSLSLEIDKTNSDDYKVVATVTNLDKTSSNINFNSASYFIHKAIDGVGTDETLVAAVATALTKISYEDGIDGKEYFDQLDDEYTGRYGESLTDAIEGDFSGNAEVLALNMFKREIEDSALRGIDIENILVDIGLSIGTFGAGGVIGKVAKTTGTASRGMARVAARGAKPITKGIKGMISRLPGFSKLSKAKKLSAIKSNVKVGEQIIHTTKRGKNAGTANKYTVKALTEDGIVLTGGPMGKGSFTVKLTEFVEGSTPKLANKILNSSKVESNLALAGLAGKKLAEVKSPNAAENFAEIMGWYSTVTADPESFINTIRGEEMSSLAQRMHDLADGVTTMGDELSMALIVTSLRPDDVKKLNDEYAKLSTDGNTMLDDLQYESSYFGSIDSDVTDLITVYVKGILGNEPQVNSIYSKIKK